MKLLALLFGLSAVISYDIIWFLVAVRDHVDLSFWWPWERTVEPVLLVVMTAILALELYKELAHE